MKQLLFVFLLLCTKLVNAQIPTEVLVGNRQTHFISYWQKDIDSVKRFNFFNLARFALDRKDKAFNNFSIESQLTYQIKPWFGVSVGGSYRGTEFIPSVGLSLSYANKKGDLYFQSYPSLELTKDKTFTFFGLAGYTPKLTKNWGLFSQVIFSTNLGVDKTENDPKREILGLFTAHYQSIQLLRLGLSYQDKYQFGVGTDLNQLYKNQGNFSNTGLFLRVNF